jgi:hypothetical protein
MNVGITSGADESRVLTNDLTEVGWEKEVAARETCVVWRESKM